MINVYPINYSMSSDVKYTGRDRPYDYMDRTGNMNTGLIDQHMGLGPATGMDFKYSSSQSQNVSCTSSNSQSVLTPPQSCDGSTISASNPTISSFVYPNQTKVPLGNTSNLEFYPPATSNFLASPFHGNNMTQTERRPGSLPMRPPSPPYAFGNSFPPYNNSRPTISDYQLFAGQRSNSYNSFRGNRPGLPLTAYTSPLSQFPPSISQPPQIRPDGPPFENVHKVHDLINSAHQILDVDIMASITKGFFRVDEKWTCYRRNYFTVVCGFGFKGHNADSQVFLHRYRTPETVSAYAVSISARTAPASNSESESRGLIQHTPKRDKATESIPSRHIVSPLPIQSSVGGHNMGPSGLFSSSHPGGCMTNGLEAYGQSASHTTPNQHTFERIQFQKATANNGKRRAQQQYFHVVVRLEVNVGTPDGSEEWVVVATKQSHQMVVRGRSPGHYKDNRRDSQASMEPDGSSSHSLEGPGSAGYSMHPLGAPHSASLGGSQQSFRHGHHYGTSFAHAVQRSDDGQSSSTSPESSETLASPPHIGGNDHLRYGQGPTLPGVCQERPLLSPILRVDKPETGLGSYQASRRHDCGDEHQGHYCQSSLEPSTSTSYNPSFDFSATSSQTLCA